jgi:hypothetical protein
MAASAAASRCAYSSTSGFDSIEPVGDHAALLVQEVGHSVSASSVGRDARRWLVRQRSALNGAYTSPTRRVGNALSRDPRLSHGWRGP